MSMALTSSRRVMSACSTNSCHDFLFSAEAFSSINSKSSTCSDLVRQIFFQRVHREVAAEGMQSVLQKSARKAKQRTHVNHFLPVIISNVGIHYLRAMSQRHRSGHGTDTI